jgi:hypothetical protein
MREGIRFLDKIGGLIYYNGLGNHRILRKHIIAEYSSSNVLILV